MYNTTLDSGFNLNYTTTGTSPERDSAGNQWNIGKIELDPTSFIDQVFAPIRTGLITLSSTYANVKITVSDGSLNTSSSATKFWGISELTVVTRKCRNCVSETIKD